MINPHNSFKYYKVEKHLKNLLLQLVIVKAKKIVEDVKYDGEDIKSHSVLKTSFKISETFSLENIKHDKDQGRDVLDMYINKVFQLGYSVGYEEGKESDTFLMEMHKEIIKELKENISELKEEIKELKK